ncbi:hypothetical protein BKA70DRAFT_1307439 [Coprinopsis sp. MPI-PUGE-AT-0042]|nr:hypothetical protein BKA70DRAFT_1307439 [Coprinopsis sp. MPI-PUGE-AT-0042]
MGEMTGELALHRGFAASFPTELLTTILRGVLPSMMDKHGRKQFQQLRMVCSHWRTVCFSTPIFWASLEFRNDAKEPGSIHYPALMDSLRGWFSRAGNTIPLALSFDDKYQDHDSNNDLIRLIQEHQDRWSYIFLKMNTPKFWKLLTMCPVERWFNLCHIALRAYLIDTQDPDHELPGVPVNTHPLADHFPTVRELTITTNYEISPLLYPAAQKTVKRLTWNGVMVEPAYILPFISQYHFLTHLIIHCVNDPFHASNTDVHIVLESLKHLSFSAAPDAINWDILGRFRTPLLSEFILVLLPEIDEKRNSILNGSMINFVDSDFGVDIIPSYIQPFFESCRNQTFITSLDLHYWPYGVFNSFIVDYKELEATEGNFFPNLESLRISEVPSRHFALAHVARSVGSLVSFLYQRMEQPSSCVKLRSLEVARGKESPDSFPVEEFEQLKESGLKVVVWAGMSS